MPLGLIPSPFAPGRRPISPRWRKSRSRRARAYRTMTGLGAGLGYAGLGYVAGTPPVAEHHLLEGRSTIAVTPARTIAGFVLTRPLDGLLLPDKISTSSSPRARGSATGCSRGFFHQAIAEGDPRCRADNLPRAALEWTLVSEIRLSGDAGGDSIGPELRALIEAPVRLFGPAYARDALAATPHEGRSDQG